MLSKPAALPEPAMPEDNVFQQLIRRVRAGVRLVVDTGRGWRLIRRVRAGD